MNLIYATLTTVFIFFLSIKLVAEKSNNSFQQEVNFQIDANLDDTNNTLQVQLLMDYHNNSPDTLYEIHMHLWANAYKNNETAMARQFIESGKYEFHFAPAHKKGGYQSIQFRQSNQLLNYSTLGNHIDVVSVYLAYPIPPEESAYIAINYVLQFPDASFSRLGHHNQMYFATQWYPKPAVYNHNGWNTMPYLHRGEFFSEFGDYEVSITLPENYLVASTGELTSNSEKTHIHELALQTRIHGIDNLAYYDKVPPSSTNFKTIAFKQEKVHDFAWFASKQFHVLKDEVTLFNGNQVTLYSFFTEDAEKWFKVNEYLAESATFMSELIGSYPWNQLTAVQGIHSAGANMEYPAITIIGPRNSDRDLERVIVHEVIHNWFYGILASNERAEPWIDEGFTTYYERRFMEKKYPGEFLLGPLATTIGGRFLGLSALSVSQEPYLWYMLKAARKLDQAPGLHTKKLTEFNYYAMTYFKAAMAIQLLEEYLGSQKFDSIMKDFYDQWKFRQPEGSDIRRFFHQHTSKNIDWFFDDLIATHYKSDIRIGKVDRRKKGFHITLHNKGKTQIPFTLSGISNTTADTVFWVKGFPDTKEVFMPGVDYTRISIDDNKLIPEINRSNNHYRTSGILRRKGTPELQFLASVKDPLKPKIYYVPVLGYNANDGFIPGMAFYNYFFPVSRNDIFIMPMYSTGRDKLSGQAWFYRDFYPSWIKLPSIRMGGRIKSFGLTRGISGTGYQQLEGSLKLVFSEPLSSKRVETFLRYKGYWVERELLRYNTDGSFIWHQRYFINKMEFIHNNSRVFNPYRFHAEVIQGEGLLRTSFSAKILFPLAASKKGFHARIFAGGFPVRPSDPQAPDFRLSLQGQSPARTALYDHTFVGLNQRPGTLWGNQIIENYGGFKYPTPIGLTWEWLVALNLAYDLPGIPFSVFFDTGTYYNAGVSPGNTRKYPFVSGIQASLLNNIVAINIPLFVSEDIKEVASLNKLGFRQTITFSIRFDKIDPMRARRHFHILLN